MRTRRNLLFGLAALPILAACGGEAAPAAPAAKVEPTKAPEPAVAAKVLKVGLVTDVGKVDDRSFNESAWNGAKAGAAAIKGESKYVETRDPNDYKKNIQQFVSEKYDVIVTVGFLLGDATIEAAKAKTSCQSLEVFIGQILFRKIQTGLPHLDPVRRCLARPKGDFDLYHRM